jgi:hypothetical protein
VIPEENQNNPSAQHHDTQNEAKHPDVSVRDQWPQKNLGYVFHVTLDVA